MTDETETPAVKPTRKRRKQARPRRAPAAPKAPSPKALFKGITSSKCCDGCTADHCLISTVNVCKHPIKTSDSGCGPITMANRAAAKKVIKHDQIDAA